MSVHPCDHCEFEAKSPRGLAAHCRAKHPSDERGPNLAAVELTLAELRRIGRLERIDEARVQAARSMARALDEQPFNSQMWREYHAALERLTADGDDSGAAEAIFERMQASVRDSSSS